jgi:hypothetical protein
MATSITLPITTTEVVAMAIEEEEGEAEEEASITPKGSQSLSFRFDKSCDESNKPLVGLGHNKGIIGDTATFGSTFGGSSGGFEGVDGFGQTLTAAKSVQEEQKVEDEKQTKEEGRESGSIEDIIELGSGAEGEKADPSVPAPSQSLSFGSINPSLTMSSFASKNPSPFTFSDPSAQSLLGDGFSY